MEERIKERLEPALKWCKDNKKRINEKPYEWYANNKDRLNKYHRKYRIKSSKNRLTERIRHLMNYSLRRKGIERDNKCWKLLGYSVEQLMKRLNKTIPEGYTWQDFLDGKLDTDHIKSIKSFDYNNHTDKEFQKYFRLCTF